VGQKILVVEDNELNLRLFCDLLRVHGYEAEPVRDGREAVDRARAFAPDLIVMDIQMPHISGLELIDQLKADEELKAIPVMAVTAYAAKGDEERIRDAGAEGYVSKPISVMRFIEAVRALLSAAEARMQEAAATAAAARAQAEADAEVSGAADEPQANATDRPDGEPSLVREPGLLPQPEESESGSSEPEWEAAGDPNSRHLRESGDPDDGAGKDPETVRGSSPG
jgi:two-component system cell cycle response regulator DivK